MIKNVTLFFKCIRNDKKKDDQEHINKEKEATHEIEMNLRELHKLNTNSIRRKKAKQNEWF